MNPLLIVFCKNLVEGQVKTRIENSIGRKKALLVYKRLVERTKKAVLKVNSKKIIYYSDYIEKKDNWFKYVNQKKTQKGENLGERITNAFKNGFISGFFPIILIGSDLWNINSKEINFAFKTLEENDYVIGPACDGGYYLIGMRKKKFKLFENKSWSTDKLLSETLKDLTNEKIFFLDKKNDIDTIEDLKKIKSLQRNI
ncbi:MAG: TIGR04282 family arsenosugar biosynthesis glycosyltransferase [Flavobacteriaceae bacterium]|nr:TIGR04282 family arsenosugar biosynthesis glycosyltransferase [Flavobacteriaceae bacterium]